MVDDDDFEEVEREAQQYAERIFGAILTQPDDIPANVPVEKRSAWRDQQATALEECQKLMRSTNDIRDACALALFTVREAVSLHRNGIPVRQLEKKSAKRVKEDHEKVLRSKRPAIRTKANNPVDKSIKCSQRIDKISKAMVDNKLIAEDFLDAKRWNIIDLVRSPTAVTNRKLQYLRNTLSKKSLLSDGKKFRSGANTSQAATPSNGGPNAGRDKGDDLEDAEHESDDEID
jgi:hypothetical protein